MRVWIFSDLHFTDSDSSFYRSFLKTLESATDATDVVVFSGDIFDLVIGNSSYFKEKFAGFFASIGRLSARGVKLHYIEGNHDFHLNELFPSTVQFHEESVTLIDESVSPPQKIYIAHGDLVDPEDEDYLRLRAFLRSKSILGLSRVMPGRWIELVGNTFSRSQKQKERDLPEYWPETRLARLRKVFRDFARKKHDGGYDFVVLGHCHDLDQVVPYYFNMGYPPVHEQYLFYGPNSDGSRPSLTRQKLPLSGSSKN